MGLLCFLPFLPDIRYRITRINSIVNRPLWGPNSSQLEKNFPACYGADFYFRFLHSFLCTIIILVQLPSVVFNNDFNLLATDFFFQSLAHPVFKM